MTNKEFKGSMVQGSRVQSFEDLNVYKQARELTNKIYEITKESSFSKDYGLADQIRRASVSIMSNIAEGFERGTNTEFIHFLFIAKGSCGEVRSQLTIALDQKYIDENTYKNLVEKSRRISGMLGNLITYLKGSRFRGSKFKRPPAKSIAEEINEILQKVKNEEKEE